MVISPSYRLLLSGVLASGVAAAATGAWAMGRKSPPKAGPPAYATPQPVRKVRLQSVGTQVFQLPNGSKVDLSADLNTMLLTAVTQTNAFSPTDPPSPGNPDPCDTHLEIRAAVSSLELNVASLGITIGYTPSGSDSVITGIDGSVDVKLGTVAMDFSVWECAAGSCSAVAATTSSAVTAGVDLSAKIDFGVIKTGPDLVYNTPLGDALRSILGKGVAAMAASPRLGELSWSATVREYLPETGMLVFDAGAQSRLAPDESFVVYAVTPSTGICSIYLPVAQVHTTRVDTVSSTAIVDQVLDPRGIHDGDLVMVRAVGSQP